MEEQKTTIQTKPEEDRILWLGMILIIVGTVSFSSYEIVGNMLTLVGGVIVVGNCIWSRWNK